MNDQQTSANGELHRQAEVAGAFLKLGAMGYGGPAIWGLIQSELQDRRAWLSKEQFIEGLALVNALPGATATQMCIFAGYVRAGWWGGLIAGVAFMVPAFAIMLGLTILHATYGALPLVRDAFYGLGPVVLGIFVVAVYRLGKTAIKDVTSIAIALTAAVATFLSPVGIAGTLLLAGCAGVALYHSRKTGLVAALAAALLIALASLGASLLAGVAATGDQGPHAPGLWDIGAFFLKVGAVIFGGGITIIAFVQEQVVNQLHWITAQEFLEGLALGQFTPGPMIMVAAYIGYKLAGVSGATVGAVAIFLPSFILMLSILPFLERVRKLAWIKAAMRGISPAVVGTISMSIVQLAPHAAPDLFTGVLLVLTVMAVLLWRLPAMRLLIGGGVVGILARFGLPLLRGFA
jgi:chromate transporter